ncbi:MAG: CoA transferase, partial [Actinobacteria bacterium]|nr:CoA transferase [Actinomycetota bacterium]
MPEKEITAGFLPRYRVLDLADEKGTYCGKLLGDLGSDVIKVEPPGGDRARSRGPFYKNEVHPEKSLSFLYFNTSKGSITLNLEDSTGQAIFKRLVEKADVVVESFPVGYLASLGLGYSSLRKINPKLVMSSVTPFGQKGPLSGYKAADINIMAMSGYMQLIGEPDQPPLVLGGEQ